MPDPLVELRVLDGPNLYFPRAALKLTLDVAPLVAADTAALARVAAQAGLRSRRPGPPGTDQRRLYLLTLLRGLARRLAAAAGTHRLAVRARRGPGPDQVVVAAPWRHRGRAEAFGNALAGIVAQLPTDALPVAQADDRVDDLAAALTAAAAEIRAAEPGPPPATIRPRVPVVQITGTNGKTTTTRMVGHMARVAGLRAAWCNTDGVYVDGDLLDAGDWSGPGGARQVLSVPGLDIAIVETARGGILLRGIGITANDVSVVTNVSADHLGLQGINTLDELAEVKAVVPRITKATGWAVLNADDPRVLGMRSLTRAAAWVFSLDPAAPGVRAALSEGGRACTVLDGALTVLTPSGADALVPLVDVPMTMAGLSAVNVANALGAAAAGLAVGLPRTAVVEGLRTFLPDPALNPGRMNTFGRGEVVVVVDLAHNEAGLEALLQVGRGLTPTGARLRAVVGTPGDRTDELLHGLGVIAGRMSDRVLVALKTKYLRGRDAEDLVARLRAGCAEVGITDVPAYPTEIDGLAAAVAEAGASDVVVLMCHAQREEVYVWLAEQGFHLLGADGVRERVLAGRTG